MPGGRPRRSAPRVRAPSRPKRPGFSRPVFHLFILLIATGAALYAASNSYNPGFAQSGEAEATLGLSYPGVAALGAKAEARAISLSAPAVTLRSQAAVPPASAPVMDEEALRLSASRSAGDPLPPAAPASPTPVPTPDEPPCDRTVSPLYCVYTVRSGDTLSTIATQFGVKGTAGVSSWELVVQSNKPDIISADDFIQPGQKLRVPLKSGIVHVVLTGETLSELASAYGVDASSITDAANSVASTGTLNIGQELLISGPERIPPPKTASAVAAAPATPTNDTEQAASTPTDEDDDAEETPTAVPASASASATPARTSRAGATATPSRGTPPARARSSPLIWPAAGPISSYFGPSHPLGIDIDLYADPNAQIVAAAAGTVTFAGGNTCCSYGLYVIVDHGNGITTLYAHLSSIRVSAGQKVTQGQVLGLGGRTGYATGNHLHFEVRLNDAIIDPLSVLP